jgi:carbamoyltransferase
MKTIWGVVALNHDASITVVRGNEILFAGHSERYSRVKNDPHLNAALIEAAGNFGSPDEIVWFEKPYSKKVRQAFAGQWGEVISKSPQMYLNSLGLDNIPVKYVRHHESHAAAGYFTSKFTDAAIIVVDAIGEWDTISVWEANGTDIKKVWSAEYPNSVGMLYSAFTQRVGLKPNEEEYIMMGMAAYGKPNSYYTAIRRDFIEQRPAPEFVLKENVHRGILHWRPEIQTQQEYLNIAASIQAITVDYMKSLVRWTSEKIKSKNLVLMGGVALNCVANEKIARMKLYNDIWIMPNPGDAGSSLGCILASEKQFVNWEHPYLGTDIDRPLDVNEVVDAILSDKIIGIANGRAEFGPRALGNRSLIADPRGDDIKQKVNDIKKRQRFRPFAPIVLAEHAKRYFDMPVASSPYMQFTARCFRPDLFPAICHVDGTSRVQTLTKEQNPKIHAVLEEFYKRTGCPILLNTSLNIKGEPLVDTWEDALSFQKHYKVRMF